ncbi:TPA: hypothetical protein QCW42_004088 [Bacillus cereus]|nr:hypothetical protein [Bacillus cereus]
MSNIHDSKRRPEVGVKDMDKYENGGLEVEERLTNGYLMYVPYGIHCDIFESIEVSIRLMSKRIEELNETLNTHTDYTGINPTLKRMIKEQIDDMQRYLHVLEKISPIKHEI